jgi:cell division protein FtsB
MDLASLSYYTSHDVLSYVRVAGQTGFDYKLSFAVPKSMPDMIIILNAGLKEITPSEHAVIKDRWITFPKSGDTAGNGTFLFLGTPLWAAASIIGVIIIAILLTLMVVHTRRHHRLQIASLSRTHKKEQKLSELTEELKELEGAHSVLNENMEEIKSLEKQIEEKIEHIND